MKLPPPPNLESQRTNPGRRAIDSAVLGRSPGCYCRWLRLGRESYFLCLRFNSFRSCFLSCPQVIYPRCVGMSISVPDFPITCRPGERVRPSLALTRFWTQTSPPAHTAADTVSVFSHYEGPPAFSGDPSTRLQSPSPGIPHGEARGGFNNVLGAEARRILTTRSRRAAKTGRGLVHSLKISLQEKRSVCRPKAIPKEGPVKQVRNI